MASNTYTTAGTFTHTCEAGTTSVDIECWGSGSGGLIGAHGAAGSGGGGGGYSKRIAMTIAGGAEFSVTIGAAGASAGNGAASVAEIVMNVYCQANGAIGQTGGVTTDAVGDTKYSGGNGSNSVVLAGGGGGSSAGTAANGTAATDTQTGATAPAGGGNGGNGGAATASGSVGTQPGGGGGGVGDAGAAGGVGGAGKIIVTEYAATGVGKKTRHYRFMGE